MSFHSEQTAIHRIQAVEYADAAERLAATGFVAVDVGKVARQLDNDTFFILISTTPTWVEITDAAGNMRTVDNLIAGQLLLGDGGLNVVTEPGLAYDGTTLLVLGAGGIETNGTITVQRDGPSLTLDAGNVDLGEGGSFSIEDTDVISWNGGNIALENIEVLDSITQATILGISGNVNTPDDLLATQLLLGNGGGEIVTEPTITYVGGEFRIANDVGDSNIRLIGNVLSTNETVVLTTTPNPLLHAQIGSGVSLLDILATSDDNVSAAEYRFGRNSLSTGENRILLFNPNGTTVQTRLATSGENSFINLQGGKLGVGINPPISSLHLYEDSSAVDATAGLTIEQDGFGDTMLHFVLSGTQRWAIGIDNSESDMLKIQSGDTLDGGAQLVLDANGKTGIGNAVPPDRCLHVGAVIDDVEPLLKYETTGANGAAVEMFFGLNNPEGLVTANPGDQYNRANGVDSGLFIFAGAAPGNTGWTEVATTSDVLVAEQILLGNGTTDITSDPGLTYNGTSLIIGDTTQSADGRANDLVIQSTSDSGITIFSSSGDRGHIFFGSIASVHSGEIIYRHNAGGEMNFSVGSSSNVLSLEGTAGMVGINQVNPVVQLHVTTGQGDTGAVTRTTTTGANGATVDEFIGTRDPEGLVTGGPGDAYHRANGVDSDLFIFKGASEGTAGWRASVTTPDVLLAQQLLLGDDSFGIVTEPDLVWDGTHLGVRVSSPDTTLDVDGNTSDALRLRSGNASGIALNQIKLSLDNSVSFTHAIKSRHNAVNQFDNAIDFYLWDADSDDIGDVGTMAVLSMLGDGQVGIMRPDPTAVLDILSVFGDTTPIIKMESASNVGVARLRVGDRDPNGTVNGIGPDTYYRDAGTLSGVFENRGASSNSTWLKQSVSPSNIIEITNSDELDDLASGGVITISENTTLVLKADVTTANRFNVTGAFTFFHITGEYSATASITYTGTDTFITSESLVRLWAQMRFISTSTGTFMDVNGGGGVNLREINLIGWDDLGTVANTGFFMSETFLQNIGSGFTLTNNFICTVATVVLAGMALNGPMFTINTNNPFSLYSFAAVSPFALGATGSLLDLDTRINNNAGITVTRSAIAQGNLFRPSVLTDATINSVADGSPATGTITAMADNGSGGTTISSTTAYFDSEEVTQSGTTSYNGTFQIFNVVAGVSYDIIAPFVADDATGSIESVRLTLSLAGGHGISAGDSIKLIDTNFYNGFETTLNVVSDDITVNGVFISTNTGSIERDLSLDHSDPRVFAIDNKGFADSHDIACAHVNDNVTANGAITNNVFTDMVFGTAGTALIASSTMERWKLMDELNGTFEFIGNELFDGSVTFDFTVNSSGGTVEFRFKWMIDRGAGFVDLTDEVEALVAVGSSAQSITKTYPLAAVVGDRIKPQITRNSGASTITATYVTMYVSQ